MKNARKQSLSPHSSISRQCHHHVTALQVSHDRGKFRDIRIVTNNHYFVCHISAAINLIYYYWFEMYQRNKNLYAPKTICVCEAGKIASLSLDSTL